MAHECPDCGQACYCDGDDTWMDLWATGGDCCHTCPEDENGDYGDEWAGASCPGCGEPVDVRGETCGAVECGGKRLPEVR